MTEEEHGKIIRAFFDKYPIGEIRNTYFVLTPDGHRIHGAASRLAELLDFPTAARLEAAGWVKDGGVWRRDGRSLTVGHSYTTLARIDAIYPRTNPLVAALTKAGYVRDGDAWVSPRGRTTGNRVYLRFFAGMWEVWQSRAGDPPVKLRDSRSNQWIIDNLKALETVLCTY